MNLEEIRDQLRDKGIDPSEYEHTYKELVSRRIARIEAQPHGELGDARRIREYALVLRQILLHRAIKLFAGALDGLRNDNGYAMCLCIRGHYETTAALGYLHNRLHSLKQGSLSRETVHQDIATQILGTRDESMLSKLRHPSLEAKQILNLLEYADRSVSKHVLGGTSNKYAMLMDNYKFLCEFSHPNFHSNALAFAIDRENKCFVFNHDKAILDRDANLIGYLLISNPLFVALYDRIAKLLPEVS
jgi:hypothetical protein